MLQADSAMLTGVLNCWRMELADSALDARRYSGSRSSACASGPQGSAACTSAAE